MRGLFLILIAGLIGPGTLLAATGNAATPLPPGFDELAEQVRARFAIPGIAVAVVHDGRVVLARGYGEQRLGGDTRVNERTRFPIASNTKAFTGTALALLVEDGRLAWDDPVVKHLPDFALNDPYVTAHLTVRDLLVHNSGLPLGGGDLLWWPETRYDMDELIHRLRHVPLTGGFRAGYAYDNVLYGVAGKLTEVVSGRRWSDFVGRRILKPLGMSDTRFLGPGTAAGRNTASPHAEIDGVVQTIAPFESSKALAAGGLVPSARDMARWLQVQLAGGAIDGEQRLFSAATSRDLWSIVTPMPVTEPPCEIAALRKQFSGYALGFAVEDYRGERIVRHGGGLPGYVSEVLMVPGRKLGIAVMTNQQVHAGIIVLSRSLLDHVMGAQDTDWLPVMSACHASRWAEYRRARDAVTAAREEGTAALPDERLIGLYRDAWYGDIEIRQGASGLELDFLATPQLLGDMSHWHYNSYRVRWRNAPLPPNEVFITFSLDARGRVSGAKLEPVSPFTDFSYDFTHLDLKPVPLN